ASSEFAMLSAALSRCSADSRSSVRPMLELSFSNPSWRVTMPISAKATKAIEVRPRSRRSRIGCPASRSSNERVPTASPPPVLERLEGNGGQHAAIGEEAPGERQRAVELPELVVDRDPQCLEGALGGMTSGEASGSGDGGVDGVHQLERRADRPLLAPAHDR